MLAGFSPAFLSQRHQLRSDAVTPPSEASRCHFRLQDQKMSTQQFNITRSLGGRKDLARISATTFEKPPERTRSGGTCSFKPSAVGSSSSASIVAHCDGSGVWRRQDLKRLYEWSSLEADSSSVDRAKRRRAGEEKEEEEDHLDGQFWFPPTSVDEPTPFLEDEDKLFSPEIVKDGEGECGAGEGKPDSSSSSDSHYSSPKQVVCLASNSGEDENIKTEQQGFELVSLLMGCTEAISSGDFTAVNYYLARLGEEASPMGSPAHRVVAYFTEALTLRVAKLLPHVFSITSAAPREADIDDGTAFRLLNNASPIPMFLHFTLNERLLRVFEGKDRVHIIDFDIKQGLQWPALFQSLASRKDPPSHVRITGIGESRQALHDTGARLAALAEGLNLRLEFHAAVVERIEDVRLWMLHVKEGECVAVNCLFQLQKLLYDESRATLMDLLGIVRSANPAILVVANEEADHNDRRWEARVANALRSYSAVFDSIDRSLPPESPARGRIEEMFGRKIRNIVACEGGERVERHERFGTWRELLEGCGYRCRSCFGETERIQNRMILRMYPPGHYSVDGGGDGGGGDRMTLKWLDQPLYTVSAWVPADIAGEGSSVS